MLKENKIIKNILDKKKLRILMSKLDAQPEEVQRLVHYLIAEYLVSQGRLKIENSFEINNTTFVLYKDKSTGQIIEAQKPKLDQETLDLLRAQVSTFIRK